MRSIPSATLSACAALVLGIATAAPPGHPAGAGGPASPAQPAGHQPAAAPASSSHTAPLPAAPSPAAGAWSGRTGSGRAVRALVLDDGNWFLAYAQAGDDRRLAGVVQGRGWSGSADLWSPRAWEYDLQRGGSTPVAMAARLDDGPVLSGHFAAADGRGASFRLGPVPAPAPLATPDLPGRYQGWWLAPGGARPATLDISSTGEASGRLRDAAGACTLVGGVRPQAGWTPALRRRHSLWLQAESSAHPACRRLPGRLEGSVVVEASGPAHLLYWAARAPGGAGDAAFIGTGSQVAP